MRAYEIATEQEALQAFSCAQDMPIPFWVDGLPLATSWFAENLGRHVEGFHLEDDKGHVIGHIYWAPSDRALVAYHVEDGAAFVYCESIRRDCQRSGYMRLLFGAFADHLRGEGCKGILVGGTEIDEYMHHRHFEKRGFRPLGIGGLLYLPMGQETVRLDPLPQRVSYEVTAPVEVLIVGSLFCPVSASAVLSIRRVAREFDWVKVTEVPAGADALATYGVAHGIFINGKSRFFGPVTFEEVRAAVVEEIGRLGRT